MPSANHARAPGRPYETAAPGTESMRTATSEALQQPHAELPRRPGETQTGIDGTDVMLVREVIAVHRRHEISLLPRYLRIEDVARFDQVAAGAILEQRRPLLGYVPVVDSRRKRVAAIAQREVVLHAEIES